MAFFGRRKRSHVRSFAVESSCVRLCGRGFGGGPYHFDLASLCFCWAGVWGWAIPSTALRDRFALVEVGRPFRNSKARSAFEFLPHTFYPYVTAVRSVVVRMRFSSEGRKPLRVLVVEVRTRRYARFYLACFLNVRILKKRFALL